MTRSALGLSALVLALSANSASAQSPAIGQLPLPGDLYGYSPLVPTIDPFPSRSSGYAPSMFLPRVGGTRIHPPTPVVQSGPTVPAPGTVIIQGEPGVVVGPVAQPTAPVRGFRRFAR
ncbi:unnamed protein product [Gemmataceae bacterium]|nr:unnamed protein product [Gemmataceae bacterium]VTT98014.1 unnamed protein product [Gemmataceae bacterium]